MSVLMPDQLTTGRRDVMAKRIPQGCFNALVFEPRCKRLPSRAVASVEMRRLVDRVVRNQVHMHAHSRHPLDQLASVSFRVVPPREH